MSRDDTIFALSSGVGTAALAVVRLSGRESRSAVKALTRGGLPAERRFTVRELSDPSSGEVLDQAVILWLPGPRSFTGEDCVEFHVHGSTAVLRGLFDLLSCLPGVRLAEPGEFTRRAFSNGKMDLVEAEGLGDLLAAQTAGQRRQALNQMMGNASSIFDSWREQLIEIRGNIEAVVDFVDEQGVAELAAGNIGERIEALLSELRNAMTQCHAAEAIRTGVKVVLAGFPNTGKSSLTNVLVKRDVSIVSGVAGTTRDVIETSLNLGGFAVLISDTAGLRAGSVDEIEVEGIRRSRVELAQADIVIWVASPDIPGSDVIDGGVSPDFVVIAKSDLVDVNSIHMRNNNANENIVYLSAKTGEGVDAFTARLQSLVQEKFGRMEHPVVIGGRQRDAVEDSIRFLNDSLRHDLSALELKAEDVRRAADAIGRVTGRTGVEDWLGAIFSRFCIGK